MRRWVVYKFIPIPDDPNGDGYMEVAGRFFTRITATRRRFELYKMCGGYYSFSVMRVPRRIVRVHLDWRDWWVGWYRGDTHNYVCIVPCVAIVWRRRGL